MDIIIAYMCLYFPFFWPYNPHRLCHTLMYTCIYPLPMTIFKKVWQVSRSSSVPAGGFLKRPLYPYLTFSLSHSLCTISQRKTKKRIKKKKKEDQQMMKLADCGRCDVVVVVPRNSKKGMSMRHAMTIGRRTQPTDLSRIVHQRDVVLLWLHTYEKHRLFPRQ